MRLQFLFRNAGVAMEMAREAARVAAEGEHKDYTWREAQVSHFPNRYLGKAKRTAIITNIK